MNKNFSCKMADELQEWMRKSTLKMESVPKGRKSRKSTKKMSEFRNLLSKSDFKISKMANMILIIIIILLKIVLNPF